MCGISGIVALATANVDPAQLRAMTQVVAHRGPDGEGLWSQGRVGLGHRRLAIIDTSTAGAQPMSRGAGALTIVFNGEIYNYIELREELRGLGQVFTTATDTEVILAAYEVWGDLCVQRFNGMWSFVIHDRFRQRLFCSRDRFGVKPFYYAKTQSAWIFASEIRQLLPFLGGVRARRGAVMNFLFASISEERDTTFYEEVEKLPAGHNLVYDLRGDTVRLNRYYHLVPQESERSRSLATSIEQYGSLLESAVALRLRSDVPVGTCLSGGLDSSTVTTLAAPLYQRASGRPFCAITACSEDPQKDESKYAKLVAERLNLKWFTVRPTYREFAETLDSVVLAQEEPFPRASMCMQYFVMRCARQNGIPVLLDGQGGDETLLGYERYYAAYLRDLLARQSIPAVLRAAIASRANNSRMALLTLIQYLVFFNFPRVRYWRYRRRAPYLIRHPAMPPIFGQYARVSTNLAALQQLELEHTNLPALLRYEDKNSMWHSVESRLPFLDYRVVEMALSLASEVKIADGWTKYPLRRYMDDKMPAQIAWRRDKIGFEAPDSVWLREHRSAMRDSVSKSHLLRDMCHSRFLGDEYPSLDANTQWRLFSVAKWESAFRVQ